MKRLSYISPKAEVRPSAIHGKGLFAVAAIAKDEVVCVKGGAIFDRATLDAMHPWYGAAEIQIDENLFIGPRKQDERDGSMIYSNHSCEPNIGVQGQIVFVAMRDIQAGEELTHDWATTDDDDYSMECHCEQPSCRKKVTGQDWKNHALQQKYRGYIAWHIERKIRKHHQS